ncbi:DUF502 domain-containing protein [Gilvimarinus sp. F26214L]|uniref:DUF502 domain-containing protein n=1 Tax=Gilvimarinus sp. DZF01 TaxID=3461371 RepID=UPI0040463D01
MKTIANIFLKGLLLTLPAFITFGLIYWLFAVAEELLRVPLSFVLPAGWYLPGMGVVSALGIIFLVGLLVQAYLVGRVFHLFEGLVQRIPLVKTLYGGAKDLLYFLAGGKNTDMQKVVSITLDGNIRMIGFVTNQDVTLGDQDDLITVYLPLSYQIGGFLLYLPKSRCEPLDIPVQQAMQQVLTAHVMRNHDNRSPE